MVFVTVNDAAMLVSVNRKNTAPSFATMLVSALRFLALFKTRSLPEAAANGVGNIGVMRIFADYDTIFVAGFEPAR